MDKDEAISQQAERIVALEAELESAGEVTGDADELARQKAALHLWVESVVAVVSSPGMGRVSLIHQDGSQSGIASPDLPYRLTRPITFSSRDDTPD